MRDIEKRLKSLEQRGERPVEHKSMPIEWTVERLRLLMEGKLPVYPAGPPEDDTKLQRLIRERCEELGGPQC